jgi:hypothetical protein
MVVARVLLPKYGWPDQRRVDELSFRQTIPGGQMTDRGFGIAVNRAAERVEVFFDSAKVDRRHERWLETVRDRVGLGPLSPQPFWGFQELFLKASTKMLNSFYVEAESRKEGIEEYFNIQSVLVLQGFDIDRFVAAIESGQAPIDFDARTHHNHGTKFRLRQDAVPGLYRYSEPERVL